MLVPVLLPSSCCQFESIDGFETELAALMVAKKTLYSLGSLLGHSVCIFTGFGLVVIIVNDWVQKNDRVQFFVIHSL